MKSHLQSLADRLLCEDWRYMVVDVAFLRAPELERHEMNILNFRIVRKLSGNDWFWIIFVAVISTVATLLGFLLFLPCYAVALLICFLVTNLYPAFFQDAPGYLFRMKVLGMAIPIFMLLCAIQIFVCRWLYR